MLELPDDFPHKAPEHYYYECKSFKSNVDAIWLCNTQSYTSVSYTHLTLPTTPYV